MSRPLRLALLVSGSGRTLQNFVDEISAGRLDAAVRLVVASAPGIGAIERARNAGLPVKIVDRKAFPTADAFSEALTAALAPVEVDLVLLAGFLHLWRFPPVYADRVLNIHPALLPRFGGPGMYGRRVHEAVLASGARESGCTVHLADLEYDRGRILLQRKVPIRPDDTPDTLAARVFEQECVAYPEAVRRYAGSLQENPR